MRRATGDIKVHRYQGVGTIMDFRVIDGVLPANLLKAA